MADYKILQNIDLAQNEIKEVSKIANDRQDGKDKGLLIQTGNNTSLAFNRKIDASNTINSIKGTVKDGTEESTLNIEPSKVSISNTKGTSSSSSFVLGLNSEGKEHIEAVSPLVDIKTGETGDTDYTHPYISLKEEGSKLELQSETVEIRSKKTTESSLKMDGEITGVSNSISLKDSSEKSSEKVSLILSSDGTNGTISELASKSITETVGTRSVSLTNDGIEIKDSTTAGTPSIIEVNDTGIKASKGSDSYIDISYNDIEEQVEIEEQSKKVTIKTPNKVTLTLDDTASYSASLTSKEAIKLTSSEGTLNETSTLYGVNVIESKANNIKLHTIGYTSTEATEYHPHIELQSNSTNDSILLEGKTINISSKESKDVTSDKKDSINISGTTLGIENTKTSVTSEKTIGITGTESITETSKDITLKDSSGNVSLNLKTDGTISESANTSITKTVDDTVSLTLEKKDSQHSITLENKKGDNHSKIEVLDSKVKISKGENSSYIDIQSNTIEEKSSNVTIKTPNNVTLTLNEDSNGSASLTSKGTITLTSNKNTTKETSTFYKENAIVSKADSIKLQTQGYIENKEETKHYPHIELLSDSDESNDYILLEGNKINVYSKGTGDSVSIKGTTLGIENTKTSITSGTTVAISGTESITETSRSIKLTDSLTDSTDNPSKVSLTLNSDDTSGGTIVETASTSITETVDKLSLTLEKTDSSQSITLKNEKEPDNSKIEVLDSNVKISKGSDSYINIESGTQSDFIEEQSNKVIIKTPSNNVTLTLNESDNSASLESNKGKITLTSQGDATTEYGNNAITTTADAITIKAKGYTKNTEATKYYPHIELKSTKDTNPVNSVLLEGKTIDISSEKDDSNIEDTITLSGSKLNVNSTTTEITSNTINIKKGTDNVLILNTSAPSITIPSSTATDINSKTIGLGESDSNSTTTVSGSEFNVTTTNTKITSPTTIVSGTTTIKSSDSDTANIIEVNGTSTSIIGSQADINPAKVNIGTVDTSEVILGKDNTKNTTTLKSSTTGITSPTLNVDSVTVDFKGTNQNVTFKGKGNSSVTSKVPTSIKDTTFSVEKSNTDSSITEVFKVDTSNKSTTINGTTATINPTDVNIGTGTTNAITIGRNATGTPTPTTTLQSSTTNIISPTINIGTKSPSTSVSIGKDSSTVSLKGNHNLLIETNDTTSKVQANDIKFNTSLSSNDIKIRWDSTLNSLVFEKV